MGGNGEYFRLAANSRAVCIMMLMSIATRFPANAFNDVRSIIGPSFGQSFGMPMAAGVLFVLKKFQKKPSPQLLAVLAFWV